MLNRYTVKSRIEGSNPSVSAKYQQSSAKNWGFFKVPTPVPTGTLVSPVKVAWGQFLPRKASGRPEPPCSPTRGIQLSAKPTPSSRLEYGRNLTSTHVRLCDNQLGSREAVFWNHEANAKRPAPSGQRPRKPANLDRDPLTHSHQSFERIGSMPTREIQFPMYLELKDGAFMRTEKVLRIARPATAMRQDSPLAEDQEAAQSNRARRGRGSP